MPNLSEEERKILQQARKIQDRLEAERLEAGEIDLESEGKRKKTPGGIETGRIEKTSDGDQKTPAGSTPPGCCQTGGAGGAMDPHPKGRPRSGKEENSDLLEGGQTGGGRIRGSREKWEGQELLPPEAEEPLQRRMPRRGKEERPRTVLVSPDKKAGGADPQKAEKKRALPGKP